MDFILRNYSLHFTGFVRKNVVKITVTADYNIDVNDPVIKKSILDKVREHQFCYQIGLFGF